MNTNAGGSVNPIDIMDGIPANAAREYICDMLVELCAVARQAGQEDLHNLLKLTTQAVRNAPPY